MKKLLIASSSTIHGSDFLEYLSPTLISFFEGVSSLVFIPYARPSGISYDEYTSRVVLFFNTIGIHVTGIHEFESPEEALKKAEAIFRLNTKLAVQEPNKDLVMNLVNSLQGWLNSETELRC